MQHNPLLIEYTLNNGRVVLLSLRIKNFFLFICYPTFSNFHNVFIGRNLAPFQTLFLCGNNKSGENGGWSTGLNPKSKILFIAMCDLFAEFCQQLWIIFSFYCFPLLKTTGEDITPWLSQKLWKRIFGLETSLVLESHSASHSASNALTRWLLSCFRVVKKYPGLMLGVQKQIEREVRTLFRF